MSSVNHQITLVSPPVGIPKESDFRMIEGPIPRAGAGEALVRALYLSVDPYLRQRLNGRAVFARGGQPGDVVLGGVVGQVIESNDPRVAKDDIVEGMLGWQEYAVAPAKISAQAGSRRCADHHRALRPRLARPDRVFRAARHLSSAAGRVGSGLRRRRSGRIARRSDCEDQALPGHRTRRVERQSPVPDARSRVRRRRQLPG